MDQLHRALTSGGPGGRWGARLRRLAAGALLVIAAAPGGCVAPAAAPPPLAHTFSTPEQLAIAVAGGLTERDVERLTALALTETEFQAHVWPHLPASRPERNVPLDFVWTGFHQKSRLHLKATLAAHGGKALEVIGIRFRGPTTDYGAFAVSREAEVVIRDERGGERAVRLFGSVLRQGSRYKVFSYVVD